MEQDFYSMDGFLIVERRCAEQLFEALGCVNTTKWRDDVLIDRLKHISLLYDDETNVGDFAPLLNLLVTTEKNSILLRYNRTFAKCAQQVNTLAVLNKVKIEGKRVKNHKKRKRRASFSFEQCGIPVGATLVLKRDSRYTCTVIGDVWQIDLKGSLLDVLEYQNMSFTDITRMLIGAKGTTFVSPMHYWLYEGKLLRHYYNKAHVQQEAEPDKS